MKDITVNEDTNVEFAIRHINEDLACLPVTPSDESKFAKNDQEKPKIIAPLRDRSYTNPCNISFPSQLITVPLKIKLS